MTGIKINTVDSFLGESSVVGWFNELNATQVLDLNAGAGVVIVTSSAINHTWAFWVRVAQMLWGNIITLLISARR